MRYVGIINIEFIKIDLPRRDRIRVSEIQNIRKCNWVSTKISKILFKWETQQRIRQSKVYALRDDTLHKGALVDPLVNLLIILFLL